MSSETSDSNLADTGRRLHERFHQLVSSHKDDTDSAAAWRHEYTRFSLWADNLGLHHHGHSSLDYRVREADALKKFIATLLDQLIQCIDEGIASANGASPESPISDESDDLGENLDDYDDESPDEANLKAVTDIINRLFRLSVKIRNPGARLAGTKSTGFSQVDPESGVDLVQIWSQYDLSHVEEMLWDQRLNEVDEAKHGSGEERDRLHRPRSLDEEDRILLHRVARANTRRRQQFAYWQRHRNKVTAETTRNLRSYMIQPVKESAGKLEPNQLTAPLNAAGPAHSATTISRPTTATFLDAMKLKNFDSAVSTASSRTTAPQAQLGSDDYAEVPPIPPSLSKDKFFTCPYCFTICSQSTAQHKQWREHVLRDLRPYVCTYSDCQSGDQLYDNWKEWKSHELESHNRIWRCLEHPELKFWNSSAYRDHLNRNHERDYSEQDLAARVTASATIVDVLQRPCPFCLRSFDETSQLQSHVATHLQRVALFALPNSTGLEEEGSATGSASFKADAGGVSTESSRRSSLNFPSRSEASVTEAEIIKENTPLAYRIEERIDTELVKWGWSDGGNGLLASHEMDVFLRGKPGEIVSSLERIAARCGVDVDPWDQDKIEEYALSLFVWRRIEQINDRRSSKASPALADAASREWVSSTDPLITTNSAFADELRRAILNRLKDQGWGRPNATVTAKYVTKMLTEGVTQEKVASELFSNWDDLSGGWGIANKAKELSKWVFDRLALLKDEHPGIGERNLDPPNELLWEVKAVHSYEPRRTEDFVELDIQVDEILYVADTSSEWWWATNRAGDRGWIPSNYCTVLKQRKIQEVEEEIDTQEPLNHSRHKEGHESGFKSNKTENSVQPASSTAREEMGKAASKEATVSNTSDHTTSSLYPWSVVGSSGSSPFPRYGAGVGSLATKEGDIYVHGGLVDGKTVKSDIWKCEISDRNSLIQIDTSPVAVSDSFKPGARIGHAAVLAGNAFIVWGGDTKVEEEDELDAQLHLLNITSRQWSVLKHMDRQKILPGRYGHTMTLLGTCLYFFGGQFEGKFFNNLARYDLNRLLDTTNQIESCCDAIGVVNNPKGFPPQRTNHTMVAHNDKLILFGGTDGVTWYNDVWEIDPGRPSMRWNEFDAVGFIPVPREGHAAALVGDVMYIYGGRTEAGDDLGQLAAFNITQKRWYTFQNMGPEPSPRSGHSMTVYHERIYVLGGEPSSASRGAAELQHVYILDTRKIKYPASE